MDIMKCVVIKILQFSRARPPLQKSRGACAPMVPTPLSIAPNFLGQIFL